MKNLRFISGLFLGLIMGVILSFITTCKTEPTSQLQQTPNSSTELKGIDSNLGTVYKLTIDNIPYIVVRNGQEGGIAIIKHQ